MITSLIAYANRDMGWIIDSGARNLMTYDQILIKSITSSPWDSTVTTN